MKNPFKKKGVGAPEKPLESKLRNKITAQVTDAEFAKFLLQKGIKTKSAFGREMILLGMKHNEGVK